MAEVILILGSNLDDKNKFIDQAIKLLNKRYKIIKTSLKYLSKAWGFESDNDFMNVAVSIECSEKPHDLLKQIMQIENELGRVRSIYKRYTDRTIDIDIMIKFAWINFGQHPF